MNTKLFNSPYIYYLPIISSINNETGQYQLDMDGNINSMLHKFWLDRKNIRTIAISIPVEQLFSNKALAKFEIYLNTLFSNEIEFIFIRQGIYKENVLATREFVNSSIMLNDSYRQFFKGVDKVQVISEFPVEYQMNSHRDYILYNLNWSFSGNYQSNAALVESFKDEMKLATNGYPINVLSPVQTISQLNFLNVMMQEVIYSEEFVRWQHKIWKQLYVPEEFKAMVEKFMLETFKLDDTVDIQKIIFCPFRISDDRYKFSKIVEKAVASNEKQLILVSNPTRVKIDLHGIDTTLVEIIDMSTLYEAKDNFLCRYLYISILEKFEQFTIDFKDARIELPHYELDVHLSLAEQLCYCSEYVKIKNRKLKDDIFDRIEFLNQFETVSHIDLAKSALNDIDIKVVAPLLHLVGHPTRNNVFYPPEMYKAWLEANKEKLKDGYELLNQVELKHPNYGFDAAKELLKSANEEMAKSDNLDEIVGDAISDSSKKPNVVDDNNKSLEALLFDAKKSLSDNIFNVYNNQQTITELEELSKIIYLEIHLKKRHIYFAGIGKNQSIAEKTANTFRSLGFKAHSINPVSALHGDVGMLTNGDLVIAITKSGETAELNVFLRYLAQHRKDIQTIGLQQCSNDVATSMSSICKTINLPAVDELGAIKNIPTISTIAMQTYLDVIAIYCSQAINFSKDKFLLNHPGGKIGKDLTENS